jgi:catechol 2,3-dioxygenase-like lactoylglutathione lyase family enzyme
MIDHISINVGDIAVARPFYEKALAPVGYTVLMDFGEVIGMGETHPDVWLHGWPSTQRIHLALAGADHETVQRFHAAAVAAGGTDNGGPGLRLQYSPDYYAAYVLDPAGNNLEVVCHGG